MSPKKIGRPATGSTKTKKSLTIDTELLNAAEKASNGNLSSLVERSLIKFLNYAPKEVTKSVDNIIAFPEIPLHHAAAGKPVTSDIDTYTPSREVPAGRFAVKLHGNSMEPNYPNGSIVILWDRNTLKRPVLKKGEIYLFIVNGEKCLKVYETRNATKGEILRQMSYLGSDGTQKVRALRSFNPDVPDILVAEDDEVQWIGWLDPKDNREPV